MGRWIKRLLVLSIIGGGSAAAYRMLKSRNGRSETPTATWPPFEPAPFEPAPFDPAPFDPAPTTVPIAVPALDPAFDPAPPAEPGATAGRAASEAPDWLPPVDGECPSGYPIKANDNSHIYHMPGGRFYSRPIAERCYATEAAAQRDGYRRAKN